MEIIKNRLRHFGEQQLDTDLLEETLSVIVPDTSPDALQILGTNAWVNIQEKNCVQGRLKISGQVNCSIAYLSVEGKTPYTVKAAVPFSFSKDMENMAEADQLLARVQLIHTSTGMVNPRKLTVRTQLQVLQRLYKCCELEYIEDIHVSADEGIHCLPEKNRIRLISDILEKRLVINDEIRLSSALPNDRSIVLRSQSDWVSEDVRLLPNKIMLRGRVDTALTTMDEKGNFIGTGKYSLPFSQIIECDGVVPEDQVEIRYAPAREEIDFFTSADQVTTMTFSFAAVTECLVRKDQGLTSIHDVFSTRWETEARTDQILLPPSDEPQSYIVPIKETITLEGDADRLLGIVIQPEDTVLQKNETTLSAGFHVSLLYAETDGTVMTAGKKVFAETPAGQPLDRQCLCSGTYADASAVILGPDEAQITFEAQIHCIGADVSTIPVLTACALNKQLPKSNEGRPSLLLRIAESDQTVWEIAKAYNTAPAVIASANKLTDGECIRAGNMVMIPFIKH